jgi:long-subunit acyl-CoA synthetase (AMP-forming)
MTKTAVPDWTMASLARGRAKSYGSITAARYRREGTWTEVTFDELWERVRDLALGLVAPGL